MAVTSKSESRGLAIISGTGDLPQLLAQQCKAAEKPYRVVELESVPLNWIADHPTIRATIEKQGQLLTDLANANCTDVVLAGAMKRLPFDAEKLDGKGAELASMLMAKAASGDDETLRTVIRFLEQNSLNVVAAQDVIPNLLPKAGVLTEIKPSKADIEDAARAAELAAELGKLDVGQGAVVAQGQCIALESIAGTDNMLGFTAKHRADFLPDPNGAAGVLFKGPKPGQDIRVDLPAIGPHTIANVAAAGLAGVAIEAGGVMVLGLDETVTLANDAGIFLWVRP